MCLSVHVWFHLRERAGNTCTYEGAAWDTCSVWHHPHQRHPATHATSAHQTNKLAKPASNQHSITN